MKTKLNKPRSLVSLDAKRRRAGKMKDKREMLRYVSNIELNRSFNMFLYSNLQYPIECKFESIYNNYLELKEKQDLERQKALEEGREFQEYEIIPDWFLDFSAKEEPFWFRPVWVGYSEKFKYNGLLDVYVEHNNKYYSFKAHGKDYKNNILTFKLHRRISYFYDIYEKINDKFRVVDCFHSFHNFISNIEKTLTA